MSLLLLLWGPSRLKRRIKSAPAVGVGANGVSLNSVSIPTGPARTRSARMFLRALAAPARPAAISALVAASVAGHDGAAFGAQGGVGHRWRERQLLLRVGLGGAQRAGGFAGFRYRVFGAEELRAEPAENVIHDRLGVGNLLVPGPAAGLETHVRELVHQELERDAVLQVEADRRGERIHQPGDGRTFLRHGDEDLARLAFVVHAHRNVSFVSADRELMRDGAALVGQLAADRTVDHLLHRRRGGRRELPD